MSPIDSPESKEDSEMRLYVGGLAEDVTAEDLVQRFQVFGTVQAAEIMPPKINDTFRSPTCSCRGFGYVTIEFKDDGALRKCMAVYNGSKWRGGVLKIQPAKQRFQEKMQQEEEEAIQDQIARDQDAAIQEEHDRLILGTFIDKPLTLVGPDKKDFKTKPNKKKDYFPVTKQNSLQELDWECDHQVLDFEAKKRAFEDAATQSYDPKKARTAWVQSLREPKKVKEEEEAPTAVSFLGEEDHEAMTRQDVDLSRFGDESD